MISAVHRIEFSTPNGRRKERKNQFQLLIALLSRERRWNNCNKQQQK